MYKEVPKRIAEMYKKHRKRNEDKQVTGKLADDVIARGTEEIGVKAEEKSKLDTTCSE